MGDPHVRWLGKVEDIGGATLVVGVDYDTVNIDGRRLSLPQVEELVQLIVSATWQAAKCEVDLD